MHWSSQFIRGQCIRLSMLFVADITQAFVRAANNMKYYITIVWSPLLFPGSVLPCAPFTLSSILCFIFLLFLYLYLYLYIDSSPSSFFIDFHSLSFCIFEALTLVAVWRFWLFFQIKFTTFWKCFRTFRCSLLILLHNKEFFLDMALGKISVEKKRFLSGIARIP